jgi:hypothetical protein
LNKKNDQRAKTQVLEKDWKYFANLIDKKVKPFHEGIAEKYHSNTYAFFGGSDADKSYGTVEWRAESSLYFNSPKAANLLQGTQHDQGEIGLKRTANFNKVGGGSVRKTFNIGAPEDEGDGTVPVRSGSAPQKFIKSIAKFSTQHEPAFKEGTEVEKIRHFTLRAIVQIAREVNKTSLCYP